MLLAPSSQRRHLTRLIRIGVVAVGMAALGGCNPQPDSTPTEPRPHGTAPSNNIVEDEFPLRDEDEILGVVVDGHARAYPVADVWNPMDHILHDILADKPVTVAFCNLDNCAQFFVGQEDGEVLSIRNGGADPFRFRKMLISVGGTKYQLDTLDAVVGDKSQAFPYKTEPIQRMTWGKWKEKHPESDVLSRGKVYSAQTK